MRDRFKIKGLFCGILFICVTFGFSTKVHSETESKNLPELIKEAVALVLSVKDDTDLESLPTENSLKKAIESGKVSDDQYLAALEKALSEAMNTYAIKRYDIQKIYDYGNKYIPKAKGKNFKDILWGLIIEKMEEPLDIKIATLAPDGTAWLKVPKEVLVPHITKVSKGKLKIGLYTGGIMGEDGDVIKKIEMRQLDGCGCTALGVFKAAPEVSVLSLPMMFRNYDEVDHILTTFRKKIDAYFESHGLILGAPGADTIGIRLQRHEV